MPSPAHLRERGRAAADQRATRLESVRQAAGASSAAWAGERIQSLWGGYGEIRRVELTGANVPSVIVKQVTPPPARELSGDARASRSHRRKLRSYDVELTFYRDYAARCGSSCRVPAAIHLSSSGGHWLFVLEDLDFIGYSARAASAVEAELAVGLRWLANFHATFLNTAPTGLWKVGSYWHLATRPDELATLTDAALRKAAPIIDARLNGARFKTLVHGDAKLDNFCFTNAASDVASVDFQYVGGGVGVKDVAYYLSSCLTPAECAVAWSAHLDTYFCELHKALQGRATPALEALELEAEWRALFPLAWLDFRRFLLGWAPGQCEQDPLSESFHRELLRSL